MALTHLADTSVLKRLRILEVRRAVEPMLIAGELARAGICDLEVGYSARNTDEWDSLIGAVQAFPLVQTTAEHVRRALQVQRMLAAKPECTDRDWRIVCAALAAVVEGVGCLKGWAGLCRADRGPRGSRALSGPGHGRGCGSVGRRRLMSAAVR